MCVCVSRRRLGGEQVSPCSGGLSPQVISSSVHHLAEALSHIQQGIERRFLKPPLGETVWALKDLEEPGKVAGQTDVSTGEEDSKKEQKKSKRKDEDRDSEGKRVAGVAGVAGVGVQECAFSLRWQQRGRAGQ